MPTIRELFDTYGPEIANEDAQAIALVVIGPDDKIKMYSNICHDCMKEIMQELAEVPDPVFLETPTKN